MEVTPQKQYKQLSGTASPINLGEIIARYTKFWPVFLITTILGLIASFLYLHYTNPVYEASMKILIKDEKGGGPFTQQAVFEDLGIANSSTNLENEVEILTAEHILTMVAENLNLRYRYIQIGSVRDIDLYNSSGIKVLNWENKYKYGSESLDAILNQTDRINYDLVIGKKTYKGQFGKALDIDNGSITIGKKDEGNDAFEKELYIQIRSLEDRGGELASKLKVSTSGLSSVLSISITDENQKRAIDILAELAKVYNETQVLDKTKVYESTVDFINKRLGSLTSELSSVEGNVAAFKSDNNFVDLSAAGTMIMGEVAASTRETAAMDVQLNILENIENILNRNPKDFDFVPTNTGINNLSLASLLESFNQLLLDREKALPNFGENHPNILAINQQAANLRNNILNNIKNIRRDLEITRNSLRNRENTLTNQLKSLPTQERQLIEIQRQQSIKQNLYLYLLQKREESAINLSNTVAGTRMVQPPKNTGFIKPVPKTIWALGILLGLLLPALGITIMEFTNNTIRSKADITKNTNVPIIGTIPYAAGSNQLVVNETSRSASSEMFRLLRANIQFLGDGQVNKAILVTSNISGEGKSFISLNLGITLAMAGKKVIVLEFDMRKPNIARHLHSVAENDIGITQYLKDETIKWKDIVQNTKEHKNLSFIYCGEIPPNPSELLLSTRLQNLVATLKEEFDYVIMDTPPVGLVSDTLLLSKLADITFFVVRYNKTLQSDMEIIEEFYRDEKLPKPYIVFNSVLRSDGTFGRTYGKGYGYYKSDTNWFSRLKSKFR